MVKPIERVLRSGAVRSVGAPIEIDAAAGGEPCASPGVGPRLVPLLPQLHGAGLGAELVPHVPLLADGLQHAHLRGHALLRAAEERARAAAQELAAVTFKEYALQDGNTLEATQTMLESRAVTRVPAGRPGDPAAPPPQDRGEYVDEYQEQRDPHAARIRRRRGATHMSTLPPSSPTSSRSPTGPPSRARALRQAALEHDARAPGVLRRRVPAPRGRDRSTSTSTRSTRYPTTPSTCLAVLLAGERVVPGRGVASAVRARQRRGHGSTQVVEPAV